MKSTPGKKAKTLRPADFFPKVALFSAAFLLCVIILSWGTGQVRFLSQVREGEPAPRSFFSPFGVAYVNETATAREREMAAGASPKVYDLKAGYNQETAAHIDDIFNALKQAKAGGSEKLPETLKINLQSSETKTLLSEDLDTVHEFFKDTVLGVLNRGVVDLQRKLELLNEPFKAILVRGYSEGEKERLVSVRSLVSVTDARLEIERLLSESFSRNRKLRAVLFEVAKEFIRPNLDFNEQETASRAKNISEKIEPIHDRIKKNQMIVQQGAIVTPEVHAKMREIESKSVSRARQLKILGATVFSFLFYLILGIYLAGFEKKVFNDLKKLSPILFLAVLFLVIEKLILYIPYDFSYYLLPSSGYAIMLTLLLGPRIGFAGCVLLAGLNGVLTDFNPEVYSYSLLGGTIAVCATIGVRKRSEFLKIGFLTGLVNFTAVFGYNILNDVPLIESFHFGVYGIFNALLIAIPLVLTLLPIVENLFGLATDITLLELSDLNHPLLRRMVIEAPGTYHHSLVVSTLAEGACEAIGANALLARVGGYFHDIGKMEKAEYFTENQFNKLMDTHGKLSPSMSYLVIASHVKDGIELAKKHKLKDVVIDFIPQHQGTCPIYYFYKKATAGQPKDKEAINIDDYRYPGPKPQSKETASVLLADSVEAASRSLTTYSQETIETLVKDVINGKFIDGQLDECDLTLEDLRKIQDSFIHNLTGIYHSRIQYPKSDAEPLWHKIADRKVE